MTFLGILFRRLALLLAFGPLVLAGCTASAPGPDTETAAMAPMRSARLGTQWGEGVESRVSTLSLKRRGDQPAAMQEIRYAAALPATGEPLRLLPLAGGSVELRVLRGNGGVWPLRRRGGVVHLQGRKGERYILEYRNRSDHSFEVVATVDGLDVLSGQPGSTRHRGYVLRPGETLHIEGFRKSSAEVAAFRFAAPADAYAARTPAGSVANIGVIGTALFALIDPRAPTGCDDGPCAFPGDGPGRYAPLPTGRN